MNSLAEHAIMKLEERGVILSDIVKIAYDVQVKYNADLDITYMSDALMQILVKREVSQTILTAIAIDEAAEKGLFDEVVNEMIVNDKSLYGLDEILALSIVNVYGSIALSNFGYLDKEKPGIIGEIDRIGKEKKACHTYLDDVICALAAAIISKVAHENGK